jgi:hypothetical protein
MIFRILKKREILSEYSPSPARLTRFLLSHEFTLALYYLTIKIFSMEAFPKVDVLGLPHISQLNIGR